MPISEIQVAESRSSFFYGVLILGIAVLISAVRGPELASGDVVEAGAGGAMHASGVNLPPQLAVEGEMPSLDGATGWLNTQPIHSRDLRGKVVLVGFWTYTCINWRRTEPYIRSWEKKYRDKGLVVIGVHSPEFKFEKNPENVRWAVHEMDISYPVAIDANLAVWRAFDNQYWPALYFIDARGRIRYQVFGEGEYENAELVIQQLLREAGHDDFDAHAAPVTAADFEFPADWTNLRSGENYLGYERTENFSSPGSSPRNRPSEYQGPASLKLNHWALVGDWTVEKDAVRVNAANSRILYRFHARDVHLVLGPASPGRHVRFRVLLDGHPPGVHKGTDIDAEGYGTVSEQRLYQLLRQHGSIEDREAEIEFLDAGAEAFDFTFG